VAGNRFTESARVLRTFEIAPGSVYSEEAVRRGIRKLFALGLFDDVLVERRVEGDRVALVVRVRERPRIERFDFVGNQRFDRNALEKKLFLKRGEVYSPTATQSQVDSLLRFYRQEGYSLARIETGADTLEGNQVALRFSIREGEKVRIRDIAFEGVDRLTVGKLRAQMETKRKGLLGGGELKPENEPRDREKLETYLRNQGFRDAKVVGYRTEPLASPRDLRLIVVVDQGRFYRFGSSRWEGYSVLRPAEVMSLPLPRPGDRYEVSRVERAAQAAYALYAERGFLYVNIDPHEEVRDSIVDLVMRVTEGRPSQVRFVHVTGNRGTREKVIRRELSVREGDLFRRSTLQRSQGDLMRLGLFEDVQVDFSAAESTDVDITFKTKERQVGTASAGAGYTSESGITGFLQLGHNNVLGNAQSLQLTLERGPRRSNYLLSFTEPWFRDTPTLLGFDVFHQYRELDVYTEDRRGGSVRMGRPLPWPDYSRGFITYRLEDVKVEQLGVGDVPVAYSGADSNFINQTVRTSSLDLAFTRNTTDNPFYPTRGTRLATNSELAGGIFGGAVNFNKHRADARLYFRSILPRVTTMLRGRWGVLAGYGREDPLPTYENFRLGGGQVVDPLRGYSDYQVVPEENIGLDSTMIKFYIRDSNGAIVDSTVSYVTSRVRYPGGRWMSAYTVEQQFAIVHPLHGLLFFDAGNVWNEWDKIRPFKLRLGAGIGFRLEIPVLGNIGFDWGYGFNRDDGPGFAGHFLLGVTAF
jgi:outer membrane protein insertion porin family